MLKGILKHSLMVRTIGLSVAIGLVVGFLVSYLLLGGLNNSYSPPQRAIDLQIFKRPAIKSGLLAQVTVNQQLVLFDREITVTNFECSVSDSNRDLQDCQVSFTYKNLGENNYFANGCSPTFSGYVSLVDDQSNEYVYQRGGVYYCTQALVDFLYGDSIERSLNWTIPASASPSWLIFYSYTSVCYSDSHVDGNRRYDDCDPRAWGIVRLDDEDSTDSQLIEVESDATLHLSQRYNFSIDQVTCRDLSQRFASVLPDVDINQLDDVIKQQPAYWELGHTVRGLRAYLIQTKTDFEPSDSLVDYFKNYQECRFEYWFTNDNQSQQTSKACRYGPRPDPSNQHIFIIDQTGASHQVGSGYFCPAGFGPSEPNFSDSLVFYLPKTIQPQAIRFFGGAICRPEADGQPASCRYSGHLVGQINLPQ